MILGGILFCGGYGMLKACSRCGLIHEQGQCSVPRVYTKKIKSADKYRWAYRWKKLRKQIIERDNHLCRWCLYNNRLVMTGLEVHHITPIAEDESLCYDANNLITLCRSCHEQVEDDKDSRGLLKLLVMSPPTIKK